MPTVTLLRTDSVEIQPHYTKKDINAVKKSKAIDFISEWFAKRLPRRRGAIPQIRSSGIHDRIMLLHSKTGSGKSVTLPAELYVRFHEVVGGGIVVTQPRVLLAKSLPLDIVKYYPEIKLGHNIGYQTKEFVRKPKPGGVTFVTPGVLNNQLKTMSDDQIMSKMSFIIIL